MPTAVHHPTATVPATTWPLAFGGRIVEFICVIVVLDAPFTRALRIMQGGKPSAGVNGGP